MKQIIRQSSFSSLLRIFFILTLLLKLHPHLHGQNVLERLQKINVEKIQKSAVKQTKRKINGLTDVNLRVQPIFNVTTINDFISESGYTENDLLHNLTFVHNNIPTSIVYTDSLEFVSRVYGKDAVKIFNQDLAKKNISLEVLNKFNFQFILELCFHSFPTSTTVYLCYRDSTISIVKSNQKGDFEITPLSEIKDWRWFNPEMRVTKYK